MQLYKSYEDEHKISALDTLYRFYTSTFKKGKS